MTHNNLPDDAIDYNSLGQLAVTEFCLYLQIYWLGQDFSEFLLHTPAPTPPAALDAPHLRDMAALETYLNLAPGSLISFDTLVPLLPLSECRPLIRLYCERAEVHFSNISTFARHYYPLIELSDGIWQSRASAMDQAIDLMRFSPKSRGNHPQTSKGRFILQQPEAICLFEYCDIFAWLDPKVTSNFTEALKRQAALSTVVDLGHGAKVAPFCQALEWHDESGLEEQPTDGKRPLCWRWRVTPREGFVGEHKVRYTLCVYSKSAHAELPWRIAHLAEVPLTISAGSWSGWLANQFRLGERRLPWFKFVVATLGLVAVILLIILRGEELLGLLFGN